jgi:hypothetical protein
MGDEACTVLLNNEDKLTKQILQDTEERLKHDMTISIEDPDHLQIELDLTVKESPLVNGLLTLVSVATFLAGFVAADFSGFNSEDWSGVHWISKLLFVCLLAYAEGSCLYLAICGTMACATHLRASNQLEGWENRCRIALEPVLHLAVSSPACWHSTHACQHSRAQHSLQCIFPGVHPRRRKLRSQTSDNMDG